MTFALGAGDLFKLDRPGEFEETIISRCVDQYIVASASFHSPPQDSSRNGAVPKLATSFLPADDDMNAAAALVSPTTPFSQSTLPSKSLLSRASTETVLETSVVNTLKPGRSGSLPLSVEPQTQKALQHVIERLFESCMREGRYRQVVGIAIEARNLSVLRRVIQRAGDDEKKLSKQGEGAVGPTEELMEYILDICMGVVQERSLRTEILSLILDVLSDIPTPDYFAIAKCVVYLNQDQEASSMLRKLVVCIEMVWLLKSANHWYSPRVTLHPLR
jgi:26S proteasome regulatory subunit N2